MKYDALRNSLRNAVHGIGFVFRHERNFRIELAVAGVVMVFAFLLSVSVAHTVVLLLLIAAVLIIELFNSAMERFLDLARPRLELQVKIVKDIMAAAVLLACLAAVLIGSLIFWPYIAAFFSF